MYRLHDTTVKLRIMYEGTEKIKKYEIRLFVTETTKNLMNLMAFELVTYGHTLSHIVTISLPLVRLRGGNLRDYVISHFSRQGSALVTSCILEF